MSGTYERSLFQQGRLPPLTALPGIFFAISPRRF